MTTTHLIPQAEIDAAAARLRPYLHPSPLIYASHYSALTGANVYFKLEMFQPT